VGSKLWLLDQSRKNQDALNKAQQWVTDCLQWIITDGHAKTITVIPEFIADGIQLKVQFT
jgi:phage gp46-like protein